MREDGDNFSYDIKHINVVRSYLNLNIKCYNNKYINMR